jgi:hypothetical protein
MKDDFYRVAIMYGVMLQRKFMARLGPPNGCLLVIIVTWFLINQSGGIVIWTL